MVGTVTAVAVDGSRVTRNVPSAGSVTYPADPTDDDTDGIDPGTLVDVTYDPANGNQLIDIEPVEAHTTGTVKAVSENAGTSVIADAVTRGGESFTQGAGDYENAPVRDSVGIVYSYSDGADNADNVSDFNNEKSN